MTYRNNRFRQGPEAKNRRPSGIGVREIADEIFVPEPDGCGLASVVRGLFTKARLRLNSYNGQAPSEPVMQEGADIDIGATVLPRSTSSLQRATRTSPLLTRTRQPRRVAFDALWMKPAAYPRHVAEVHPHCRTRGPRLMAGRGSR